MRWTAQVDANRYEPQRWRAWYPVRVKSQWVWLETVVRRRDRATNAWICLYVVD